MATPLIPPPTQLDLDLAEFRAALDAITAPLCAARDALNVARSVLWSLPDERLVALAAALGPERMQALFADHAAFGLVLNERLTQLGIERQVIIGAAKPLAYDPETGTWSVNWPEEPTPEN